MTLTNRCPECGTLLARDVPQGMCPACLLRGGKNSAPVLDSSETAEQATGFVAPSPAEIAERFPQLEIFELLGQGGMGAVYKARQTMLDRTVALKILPPETEQDPAFAERFTREAKAMAQLSHPNIVIVFEFGEVDGLYYLIMEYVDGVNLRQAIRAKQVPTIQALTLIPQICDALQYAHEEGIVHRDIKPENVLLDRKGRVKIADFGLAKLLRRSPIEITLTASQQVMGTLHYMAPEQLERPLTVDHRADIYSLGVVFYELLTGELPLGRFKLPSENTQLDARLDEVVLKTLERQPERRYQHASDVKLDVETISRQYHPSSPRDRRAPEPDGLWTLRLPFSLPSTEVGCTGAFGIARFGEVEVALEFEGTGKRGGDNGLPMNSVTIPLKDIVSIVFQPGILKHQVIIQTDYLRSGSKLPGIARGRILMQVDRADRETAERFVNAIRQRLMGEFTDAEIHDTEHSVPQPQDVGTIDSHVDAARKRLVGPALGLAAAGALAFLWQMGIAIFAFVQVIEGDPDAPAAVVACFVATFAVALIAPAIYLVSFRWYGWAVVAVCLALLPLSPAMLISLPCGIWLLFVMFQPDVRAAFAHVGSGHAQPRALLTVELKALCCQLQAALAAAPTADPVPPAAAHNQLVFARRKVAWPATALIVLGGINLLSIVVVVIALGIAMVEFVDHGRLWRQLEDCCEHTWFLWPSIPLGAAMLWGGRTMKQLGSHWLATAGAIAAILPCSPAFVLTAPFGIWALIVLMSPTIKAAFARHTYKPQTPETPEISDTPAKPHVQASLDLYVVQQKVRWPANGLMIVALLDFLPSLVPFGIGMFEVLERFPVIDWNDRSAFEFFIFSFGALVVHLPTIALLLFASRRMRQLKSRRLALVASVVAMLACHVGFLPGIPIGIWSLAVLTRPDVTAVFAAQKTERLRHAALALN